MPRTRHQEPGPRHHRHPASHTTVVGHGYGTTVAGSAAGQGELNADDAVLSGIPGVQVGKASGTDVPEGHVSRRGDS
ncbi:alpha/beta hydrolase [Streptomyces megasporus]|uniref:alpha/beta hydrolase n=1 Tax=Streptomyces megasporus TaxID=44060 RepID=UPI000997DBD3|nr:alpha/beta hydrolase [Streptomyces megasporus]